MILADGTGSTKLETRKFATLDAYAQATQQDRHSVLVDYDIFMKVTEARREGSRDRAASVRGRRTSTSGLRPGSAAVDRGVELPNITDGFTGQALRFWRLEVARPMPAYARGLVSATTIRREFIDVRFAAPARNRLSAQARNRQAGVGPRARKNQRLAASVAAR